MDENLNQNPQPQPTIPDTPPSPTPEDQPPAPSTTPKTKKDTIMGGAFLLVIFVLLGLTIYFAYQNRLLKNELSQVQKSQQTLSPAATSDPTATTDWKIYSNEKHGFTFRYPGSVNLRFYETINNEDYFDITDNTSFSIVNESKDNCEGMCFEKKSGSVTINEYLFTKYEGVNDDPGGSENFTPVQLVTYEYKINDNLFLQFHAGYTIRDENKDEILRTLDQILSTFKFLE